MAPPWMTLPRIADLVAGEWLEHPRFTGISMKPLLTSADNAHANINGVRVPPGNLIAVHVHPKQVETVFVVTGECFLTLNEVDLPLKAGEIIAIPAGLPHALRNDGTNTVDLLTIFTPPLV